MIRRIAAIALAFAMSAAATLAAAQAFPGKPVKLVVPYPAGQATDIVARLIAEGLTKEWGQQVVVENKGGGAAIPGMVAIRDSAPDGYTMGMGTSAALVVNPGLFAGKLAYDPRTDYILVTALFRNPLLVVANASTPYNSLKDIVDAARKSPGTVNWGYPGTGTTQHLSGELFKFVAGIDIVGVMYKGSGPAVTDLLGNQIPLAVDSVAATLPHIKSGKLRAIAMTGARRVPQLPDVPTIAELGYKDFEGEGWGGIVVPKGTPPEIVAKIGNDVRKVLADPAMQAKFIERGLVPDTADQMEWNQFFRKEYVKWGEVVRRANVKVE
jgi:tripartite-type tricarboxylate transporter receptor subunit TctC